MPGSPAWDLPISDLMRKIVEDLLALQDLHYSKRKGDSAEHGAEIEALRKRIPAPLLVTFDRSQIRGRKSVSLVRNGVCNECHLQIPIGVVTSLASSEEIQRCGNCGRYLYLAKQEPVAPVPPPPVKSAKPRRKKELAHVS